MTVPQTQERDRSRYADCMEEIKRRVAVVTGFLEGPRTTGHPITDVEFICLQFRKILELIAMSSLCANRNEYERVRTSFSKDWRVAKILKVIRGINPNYYPKPSVQRCDETGRVVEVVPVQGGYLTEAEFLKVHGKCGDYLHGWNPYSKRPDLNAARASFKEWLAKIISLLNQHQAQLVNSKHQL